MAGLRKRDTGRGTNGIFGEPPPPAIGWDERRLQERAYRLWTGLLRGRALPCVTELEHGALGELACNSVLLDFTREPHSGIIVALGERLARECGETGIAQTPGVAPDTLLGCITDRAPESLASGAPFGFEAEFVDRHRRSLLCRGILLPFAAERDTAAGFVWGAISWKEVAGKEMLAALQAEICQALARDPSFARIAAAAGCYAA